jgi:hypothetical protein
MLYSFVSTGPRYVSPAELADMLQVSRARVYALIEAKRLTPIMVPTRNGRAKRKMFAYDDALRWAAERRSTKRSSKAY